MFGWALETRITARSMLLYPIEMGSSLRAKFSRKDQMDLLCKIGMHSFYGLYLFTEAPFFQEKCMTQGE
jgi:hypothetical protein